MLGLLCLHEPLSGWSSLASLVPSVQGGTVNHLWLPAVEGRSGSQTFREQQR